MNPLTLTYSLADQDFGQTKSVGIFNVSTQLLEHLSQDTRFARVSLLSNSTLRDKLKLPPEMPVKYYDEAIDSKMGRILWDQWGVYDAAKNSGNQWLFLAKGFASFLRRPAFKLAIYIYDTIHDFYRSNYPGAMPWLESLYFDRCLKGTLMRADVIFTDSDFARGELERLALKVKLKPPPIITAGIGFDSRKEAVAVKRNSLLLLTSVWPHKFTERAVSFLERWQRQTGFSGEVYLVGSLPASMDLPRFANWRHHPRLSEIMYRQFLAEAKVLLFFSAYEGFGMPPVEAMIAGACPVFSDITVTREVMGDSGYSFSNDSYESFTQAMDKALSVSETQIQLWSKQLLERHNWDKVVGKVVNGLAEANKYKRHRELNA